jgi:nucleoside-diphosphate-sugar epimerase
VKVVITGGTGFVGLALARRLLSAGALTGRSGAAEPIDELVLFDQAVPAEPPAPDDRVKLVAGDVADRDTVLALVDRDDTSVFHLASVVSYGAEQDYDLALRVNLTGGLNVIEACRARAGTPRLVVASTYAAFGGALPDVVSDATKLTPQTTYGTTKVVLELLVNDASRKGFLDGRSARLPTVIVRPGAPNLAASSWMSAVFREPLAGVDYALPVALETRAAIGGVRDVVAGLVALHDVGAAALGHDRAVTFPSTPVTARELVECVRRVGAGRGLGAISVEPDPAIQRIVDGWPRGVDAARALALGVPPASGLDEIVRAYVEEHVDAAA